MAIYKVNMEMYDGATRLENGGTLVDENYDLISASFEEEAVEYAKCFWSSEYENDGQKMHAYVKVTSVEKLKPGDEVLHMKFHNIRLAK